MKLGGKTRDVDSFVDQLKEEGENVSAPLGTPGAKLTPINPQTLNTEMYVIILITLEYNLVKDLVTRKLFKCFYNYKGSSKTRGKT